MEKTKRPFNWREDITVKGTEPNEKVALFGFSFNVELKGSAANGTLLAKMSRPTKLRMASKVEVL